MKKFRETKKTEQGHFEEKKPVRIGIEWDQMHVQK